MTRFTLITLTNVVTLIATAKHELLFNKPPSWLLNIKSDLSQNTSVSKFISPNFVTLKYDFNLKTNWPPVGLKVSQISVTKFITITA